MLLVNALNIYRYLLYGKSANIGVSETNKHRHTPSIKYLALQRHTLRQIF